MTRGTGSMITMLAAVTLLIVLIIAIVITIAGFNEEGGFLATLWDNLATVINAWMPSSGDGSAGYVILTAVAAVAGLMITSVLIGIIASGIEERITSLKKGNSRVLESGHTVILGFVPGEYELLTQLISGAGDDKCTFLVADDTERDEMEALIRENIDIPKNIRLICRYADITDPVSMEKLSLGDCRSVIINPKDDVRTLKTILAVRKVLPEDIQKVRITAAVSKDEFILPEANRQDTTLIMLQTYDILARILAHSVTQPGLSDAFLEVLSFNGSELYLTTFPEAEGLTFRDISLRTDGAVPVGMEIDGELKLGLLKEEKLAKDSKILLFAEGRHSYKLLPETSSSLKELPEIRKEGIKEAAEKIVIMGWNEVIGTVIRELTAEQMELTFVQLSEENKAWIQKLEETDGRFRAIFHDDDISTYDGLKTLMKDRDHVLLLNDHEMDPEERDAAGILMILRLRDVRKKEKMRFTIAAEMFSEKNCRLVSGDDPTDFIIASDMASMVLSQAAESPELYPLLKELLSKDGRDLFLMKAGQILPLNKTCRVSEIRQAVLDKGCALLGFVDNEKNTRTVSLNPPLSGTLTPGEDDYLILIGDQ